jgi:hypothetical protein
LNTDDTRLPEALPRAYLVPRGGTIVRESVRNADDLRRIRTELELLRRIRRRAATWCARGQPWPAQDARTGRFSVEERDDLRQILRDAMHPIVEDVAGLIDRASGDIRKELMMSAINEEAENIVQDAVDAGLLESAAPDGDDRPASGGAPASEQGDVADVADVAPSDPAETTQRLDSTDQAGSDDGGASVRGIEEAFADVEAELAQTLGVSADTAESLVEEAVAESEEPETPDTDDAPGAVSEPDTSDTIDMAAEADGAGAGGSGVTHQTGTGPDGISGESVPSSAFDDPATDAVLADAVPPDATTSDELLGASSTVNEAVEADGPTGTAPDPDPLVEPVHPDVPPETGADAMPIGLDGASSSSTSQADEPFMAKRAEAAVAEIEERMRDLASLIGRQVGEQWRLAREAYEGAVAARSVAEETCRQARTMLSEIAGVGEEVRIARDDADIARREVKLIREDTLRARERAEASAAGAERAAERARRNAEATGSGACTEP